METNDTRSCAVTTVGFDLEPGDVFAYADDLSKVLVCCVREYFTSEPKQALDPSSGRFLPLDLSRGAVKLVGRLVVSDA